MRPRYLFTGYFALKSVVLGVAAIFATSDKDVTMLLTVALMSSLASLLFAWIESDLGAW